MSTSRAPAPLAHPPPQTQFEIETGLPQLASTSKRPPKRRRTAGTAAGVAAEATQLELPPTIEATLAAHESVNARRKLRYHANECWYFVVDCETKSEPEGVDRQDLLISDAAYQAKKDFREYQQPPSNFIRCIPCWKSGTWKTWTNGQGLTRALRTHMREHHTAEFMHKCSKECVTLPEPDGEDLVSPEPYSQDLLNRYIAEWVAIDDQAMQVVERMEFRRIILLASKSPQPLSDSDILHRTKLTKVTEDLYKEDLDCIRNELKQTWGVFR
ncbi:hypothetical protein BN14_11999 [Rhizoctonia solani AG-1 IB]|uniref:Uncharacterized protein n=1 Tax=Thanatephorus cucumeris (strain AG1-IB / isolate 7/3/14) TaxID=1108050 RepID=M5CEW4_THACB|nr:hypothetical protein BN14_11999 [Rhizoctonia solani AG-1 IB]